MEEAAPRTTCGDDPRELRRHLLRARDLASAHGLPSVVVGFATSEGELMAADLIEFVGSALRVEDSIFRLTRERAILFLAAVDRAEAETILDRLLSDFRQRFPATRNPAVDLGYFEVAPNGAELLVKDVLPAVFSEAAPRERH